MQCIQDDVNAPLPKELIEALEWTAYSLANDKIRAYVRSVVGLEFQGKKISTRNVSAATGLHITIVERGLSQLQALNIIALSHEEDGRKREWSIINRPLCNLVHRLDPVKDELEDVSDDD